MTTIKRSAKLDDLDTSLILASDWNTAAAVIEANEAHTVATSDAHAIGAITGLQDALDARTIGISVLAYGATGNGVTDDTAAIQAAFDAATSGYVTGDDYTAADIGAVYFPAGKYLISSAITAGSTADLAYPLHVYGDGSTASVIITGANTAFAIGRATGDCGHGLYMHDLSIVARVASGDTANPMVQLLQVGRKWAIERVNLNPSIDTTVGANYVDRIGIQLYTSWNGSIRDCNFARFGTEGTASDRAAIQLKPQALATGNGPINNVLIDGCAFERVQTAIDLHDPAEAGTDNDTHAVTILNCRFKNTSTSGPMANSYGIRSVIGAAEDTKTFGISIINPFFEDFAYPIQVAGTGWSIIAPFFNSATTCVYVGAGGGHSIRGCVFYGAADNVITTGVSLSAAVSARVSVDDWSVVNATYVTNAVVADVTKWYFLRQNGRVLGAAAPAAGTWALNSIVYNSEPAATEFVGWICTVAGTPGTWKGFGAIES